MNRVLLIFFVISANRYVESARILAAVPSLDYSHQVFFQLLWRQLAINGHEVVVLTTHPTNENLTNFKEIDLSSTNGTLMFKTITQNILTGNEDALAIFKRMVDIFHDTTDHQLGLPEVQQLIKNEDEHFDLVMIEFLVPWFFAFKHRFNCPFIGVMSLDATPAAHDTMGNPSHLVLYPDWNLLAQVDLTFKERLVGFGANILDKVLTRDLPFTIANELNEKHFGEGYPDSLEIAESVDMLFINNNPVFTPVRPLMPNTISVAGLHMRAPQALPEELKQFLDGSTQGVIYCSMGSNVNSRDLPNSTLHTMMKTFSQVPYNVLWKFEADELPGSPSNVKIIQWTPQQDLLRHKNIKLFITQAGLLSLEEALLSHVPLVTFPIYFDQDGNAERIAHQELGMNLNYRTLTVDEFKASILEVITNPKYKNNMKQLAQQIQDQPMPPLERAVWWTEYVLRHNGAKHLRGPKIPAYQYYYLDIFAFLAACLLFLYVALYFIGKLVYKSLVRLCRRITKLKQF